MPAEASGAGLSALERIAQCPLAVGASPSALSSLGM